MTLDSQCAYIIAFWQQALKSRFYEKKNVLGPKSAQVSVMFIEQIPKDHSFHIVVMKAKPQPLKSPVVYWGSELISQISDPCEHLPAHYTIPIV